MLVNLSNQIVGCLDILSEYIGTGQALHMVVHEPRQHAGQSVWATKLMGNAYGGMEHVHRLHCWTPTGDNNLVGTYHLR